MNLRLLLSVSLLCLLGGLEAAAQTPLKGGTLTVEIPQAPRHLNAAVQSGVATMRPATQLFASPLRYNDKWEPQAYLAEKWDLSADGKALTLHLVRNAVFHDGHPVTSEDVAFSIMTIKKHHPFSTMLAPVESVETPDPYTAIIRMSEAHPAILLAMSPALCPIIPKHIYGDGQDIATHPRNSVDVIGSGPFKFKEFVPGNYLVVERFDQFFIANRPYLDRVIFKIMPDASVMALGAEKGELSMVMIADPRIIKRLSKAGMTELSNGYEGIGAISWIAFNVRKPPLDKIAVRQALAYSLDREFISKVLHAGVSVPLKGPIAPGSPIADETLNPYALDLPKAEKLLDEAGFKKATNGERLKLTMDFIPGSDANSKLVAEYAKSQYKKIGVNLELRASPDFPSWAKRVASGDFEMTTDVVFNWGDPVIGVARTFLSTNIKPIIWSNTQGYANLAVDQLLIAAGKELDPAKRRLQYIEFQKIVNEELPVTWTTSVPYRTMIAKNLRNPPTTIWGPIAPYDEIWLDNK